MQQSQSSSSQSIQLLSTIFPSLPQNPNASNFQQQAALSTQKKTTNQMQADENGQGEKRESEEYHKYCELIVGQILAEVPGTKPPLYQIQAMNNLKFIILIASGGGVLYLIWGFINQMIIGHIIALAYHQTENRFINFVKNFKAEFHFRRPSQRILKIVGLILIIFFLPSMRSILSHQYKTSINFHSLSKQFKSNRNLTVILCQIFAFAYLCYLALGRYLNRAFLLLRPSNNGCISYCFGICLSLFLFLAIALIPVVFIREVGEVGTSIQLKVEQKLQCMIVPLYEQPGLPLCSEKFAKQNSIVKIIKNQLQLQSQSREVCRFAIENWKLNYLGYNIFHYDDIICVWYSIANKALNYSTINEMTKQISPTKLVSTGTAILTGIFGKILTLFVGFSNLIFSLTILITTFTLTTKLQDPYRTLKTIFPQFTKNQQELLTSVTALISATLLIVFWHFVASMFLLQLFAYTNINLIVSAILSSMAFVPVFRPWFGIVFVSLCRVMLIGELYICIVFSVIYYFVSEYIYSFHYKKVGIHQIITNMSVLFGFYQFGVYGIFYGPLIIIVCQYVYKQLLINKQ